INCTNCWVTGVRTIRTTDVVTSAGTYGLMTIIAMKNTFMNNYYYGAPTSALVAIYQNSFHVTSSSLVQNNIYHQGSSMIVWNQPSFRNVTAYNYVDAGQGASMHLHG